MVVECPKKGCLGYVVASVSFLMSIASEYVKLATRTESNNFQEIASRISDEKMLRLLHASMGLETETGEFVDPLKKYIFYGKEFSKLRLVEELSDIMWYLAIACDTLDIDLEQVLQLNIQKLKERYPERFDADRAINRDLEKEDKVMEQNL